MHIHKHIYTCIHTLNTSSPLFLSSPRRARSTGRRPGENRSASCEYKP